MTIVYDIGEEDVLDLHRSDLANNPATKLAVLNKQLQVAALPAMLALAAAWGAEKTLTLRGVILALCAGGIVYLICRLQHPGAMRKLVHKQAVAGELKGVLGVQQLALAPEGVVHRSPLGESTTAWRVIHNFTASANNVFIFLVPGKALIIPKRAFSSPAQKQEFMNIAERYITAAQTSAAV